jgi:hypothetical protein
MKVTLPPLMNNTGVRTSKIAAIPDEQSPPSLYVAWSVVCVGSSVAIQPSSETSPWTWTVGSACRDPSGFSASSLKRLVTRLSFSAAINRLRSAGPIRRVVSESAGPTVATVRIVSIGVAAQGIGVELELGASE